jgi:glycosyltransferase involved in cell wall biosynthesis
MSTPQAIVINLSTSGSRLGGAAIAAEWHSQFMAPKFPLELWRMWDYDQELYFNELKVRQYATKTKFGLFDHLIPKQARAFFLDSDILDQLLLNPPKIIHLQNPLPSLAFERLAHRASEAGIKVVVSTHGFFEVMNPNHILNAYKRWAWKQWIMQPMLRAAPYVDAVLSGYPAEKKMLLSMGFSEEKIHLVPNGSNPFFLSPPSDEECATVLKKFPIFQNRPILLFIGNHTANKGLDTVLKVASRLTQPATVVIGGRLSDPEEPLRWRNKIPPANQVDVVFTDYLTLTEQRVLYHLSTLLLFPSLADTLPLTIIEAMASGLPVIAYGVGGIPFQLENESGITTMPGDIQSFHTAVEYLLTNENARQRLVINGKLRQEQLFSWELAATRTVQIYEALLAREL